MVCEKPFDVAPRERGLYAQGQLDTTVPSLKTERRDFSGALQTGAMKWRELCMLCGSSNGDPTAEACLMSSVARANVVEEESLSHPFLLAWLNSLGLIGRF